MAMVSKEYKLVQFHFHSPSEHTMNGKQYAMEVHLVHKQVSQFTTVMHHNARPVQPLHARVVLEKP